MKTTCLGILLWTLLLPAFAIENSEDVPQQSRIKREVILADEIYVDDLDQAATDSLGEIVVKRVLHSPIARSSYHPYGKVFYEYDGEDELGGHDRAQNTPDDEAEDGETSARSSATGNGRRNSASPKRIPNSGESRVYDETEEPVTYYKDGARVYVVQRDTSSANERTNELTTSGRSSTNKRTSKQHQRSIRTTKEGSDGAPPPSSQRRSQRNAAVSEEPVFMECLPTDDGGKICILQNEKASSTAAKDRRGTVRLSRNNGASEFNSRSVAWDDNRSSGTQRRGQTVLLSESEKDDEENTGAEDEACETKEAEEGEVEDQAETQEEDEENPVEANNGRASGTYSNNIAFYCNCGYSGDQSQIASHVCQNSSNSSNASNSSSAVGETPSTQYKKIVIIKYSGKPSKRSIRSDATAQNVADVDQEEEEVADEEEPESQTGTNGRRVRQENGNASKPSRRVVYVIQRTGAQETSPRGNRGDETVQTENNAPDEEDDPQTNYRIVPARKTRAGGKCSCGLKQKADRRREVIYVLPPEGGDVRKGEEARYVLVKERQVEEEGEEEQEGREEQTVEDNEEGQRRAAEQYDDYEGEEGEEGEEFFSDNSDKKVIYIKKMPPRQTNSGQGSAKAYNVIYVQKPYSDDEYYDGEDCGCDRAARQVEEKRPVPPPPPPPARLPPPETNSQRMKPRPPRR